MTDKLQEFVTEWIERESSTADEFMGGTPVMGLNDLRAFLAKFVLCDRQTVGAWNTSIEVIHRTTDAAYYGTNWIPLHAPATKEPQP